MIRLLTIPAICLGSVAAAQPTVTIDAAVELATAPVVQDAEWAKNWWPQRHADKLAERDRRLAAGERIRLVWIGDSITHGWENAGERLWAERFAPYGAMNLGFSGDRTEHVLYRLGVGPAGEADSGEANNEAAGLTPDAFVVMIGTNNTGHYRAEPVATAAGVTAIVDRLHELSPDSRVLLLAIFPRDASPDGELRRINDAINERIAGLDERDYVDFVDINEAFLEDDGTLSESVMPDLLHPNEHGYRLWADAIRPEIEHVLAE